MISKNICHSLLVLLLIAAAAPLHAEETTAVASPSVKKGDLPPGNAMTFSVSQARTMLKEAIKKKYVGKIESCQGRNRALRPCAFVVLSEATDVHVRAAGFDFAAPFTAQLPGSELPYMTDVSGNGRISVNFKNDQDYIQAYTIRLFPGLNYKELHPNPLYNVGYLPDAEHNPIAYQILEWSDETAAQNFAAAFNRLLYAAYQDEESFIATARVWRESPTKPPLSIEADRHRVLAENSIKEHNLDSAIEHFESALEVQSMWPAGWFNLALIYAEQKNHTDAADCMKRYLELVPSAPDANDARNQMIIWEDKSKH